MFCLDNIGNFKWVKESGDEPDRGPVLDFEMLPDSSWIIVSATWEKLSNGIYWTRPIVVRADTSLDVLFWKLTYPLLAPIQLLTDLEKTPDGNFVTAGWVQTEFAPGDRRIDGVNFKFTPEGDTLWTRKFSVYPDSLQGEEGTQVNGAAVLSSGSIISVGYAGKKSSPEQERYGFVLKLSSDGCLDTLNCWQVANTAHVLPMDDIQVYPNPTPGELTVHLDARWSGNTHIRFYDLTGRLLRRQRLRNSHNVLDISDLPRGVLLYTVESNRGIIGRGKLIVN